MKKLAKTPLTPLLLLLMYLFISSPAILFHHHELEVAHFAQATACEKTIYYAHQDAGCHHTSHFTKAFEECFLCDTHTISAHTLNVFVPAITAPKVATQPVNLPDSHCTSIPLHVCSRGPPFVSIFTA